MSTVINKMGADWIITKAWLQAKIAECHKAMEAPNEADNYNYLRGQIAVARALIELVEPTAPPQTTEDDYGLTPSGIGPY